MERTEGQPRTADLRRLTTCALRSEGLRSDRTVFPIDGPDVRWILDIWASPYGVSVGVDAGAIFHALEHDRVLAKAHHCDMYFSIAALPLAPIDPTPSIAHLETLESLAFVAFDVRSGLRWDERTTMIGRLVHEAVVCLRSVGTLEALRSQWAAGAFRRGLVRIETRALLEG